MTYFQYTNDPKVALLVDEYNYLAQRMKDTCSEITVAQQEYLDRLEQEKIRKDRFIRAEIDKKIQELAILKARAKQRRDDENSQLKEQRQQRARARWLVKQQKCENLELEYERQLKNAIYFRDGTISGAKTARKWRWPVRHYLDWLEREHPNLKRCVGMPDRYATW